MKKILLVSAALAVFAGHAMADGIYVAGKVGGSNGEANSIKPDYRYSVPTSIATVQESSFTKNVVSWGGSVGYEYTQWLVPLRMEVEYLYRNHYQYDTGVATLPTSQVKLNSTVDSQTILANFYVDVPITKMFGVFFGGGLGQALNTSHSKLSGPATAGTNYEGKNDDAAFSWQTTAGLFVKPLKWLAIDLSYRYSDLGDISMRVGQPNASQASISTDSFAAQELYLGLRALIPNMIKKHHAKKPHTYMDK